MLREIDIISKFAWNDYRPPGRPDAVHLQHGKSHEKIWLPLEDHNGPLYPELSDRLNETPRLGSLVIMRVEKDKKRGAYLPYKKDWFQHCAQRIRDHAGLPTDLTFASFRHGGLTELGDAELTDQSMMALSAHKTRDMLTVYSKHHGAAKFKEQEDAFNEERRRLTRDRFLTANVSRMSSFYEVAQKLQNLAEAAKDSHRAIHRKEHREIIRRLHGELKRGDGILTIYAHPEGMIASELAKGGYARNLMQMRGWRVLQPNCSTVKNAHKILKLLEPYSSRRVFDIVNASEEQRDKAQTDIRKAHQEINKLRERLLDFQLFFEKENLRPLNIWGSNEHSSLSLSCQTRGYPNGARTFCLDYSKKTMRADISADLFGSIPGPVTLAESIGQY